MSRSELAVQLMRLCSDLEGKDEQADAILFDALVKLRRLIKADVVSPAAAQLPLKLPQA